MFLLAQEHWQKDVDFELRRRVLLRGDGSFLGWYDVELFASLPADFVNYYVPVPSPLASYNVSCIMNVPSPSVFSCYSNLVLRCSLLKAGII